MQNSGINLNVWFLSFGNNYTNSLAEIIRGVTTSENRPAEISSSICR